MSETAFFGLVFWHHDVSLFTDNVARKIANCNAKDTLIVTAMTAATIGVENVPRF